MARSMELLMQQTLGALQFQNLVQQAKIEQQAEALKAKEAEIAALKVALEQLQPKPIRPTLKKVSEA